MDAYSIPARLRRLMFLPGRFVFHLRISGFVSAGLLFLITPVFGQVRAQKRIGTAEEFQSATYRWLAVNYLGGLTDEGNLYAFTNYYIDEGRSGYSNIAWRWTYDDGAIYTLPSAAYSTPLSAHNQTPYPNYMSSQPGLGFYSAEPGGGVLAFSSDARTENSGLTGFNNMDPITTSRETVWNNGPTGWLPFVNHPQNVGDGMEFDLEAISYRRIYPGGSVLGSARRNPAKVIEFSASPSYWRWLNVGPARMVDFLQSSAGSARQYYASPLGYPDDRLVQAGISHGKTVGLAMRLLPGSSNAEWKGVYWPVPENPVLIDQIIGMQAYPQHITAAGEIAGVLPSFTGNIAGEPFLREGRLFLWLPKAQWGLPAGLNWLTEAGRNAQFIGMNDRGLIFYKLTTSSGAVEYYQWSSGSVRKWSFTSTTWSGLVPTGMVNNRGWVVCLGERADGGGQDYVLSYPVVDVELTVEPKEVEVGDSFDLVANVVSRSQYDVLGFGQTAIPAIAGDRNATISGTPTPTAPRTLPAGGTLTYRWRCRAAKAGEARFTVELKGTPSNDLTNVYRTLTMTSEAVTIKKAELIVNKTGDEPDADLTDECADLDLQESGRQTTLRSALQYAANIPAADRIIKFDLPAGPNRVIRPATALPPVPDSCEIDGLNKIGGITWIDGILLPAPQAILTVGADSKVRHLAFSGRSLRDHFGIQISGENNEITGCRFGQNDQGERLPLLIGIRCLAGNQRFGGLESTDGNEFLSGDVGILISQPGGAVSQQVVIEGNQFGRSSLASKSAPKNALFLVNVANSRIGGTTQAARNTFIGSMNAAVLLLGSSSSGNDIQGNWFGLKNDGSLADPSTFNAYGIALSLGAHHNRIGGSAAGAGNIISGSEESGVILTRQAHHNVISGNWIGLDSSGTGSAGANSANGILILSGSDNRIGGLGAGERNVISDNRNTGIQLGRHPQQVFKDPLMDPGNEACLNTLIEGNWIGTDRSGAQPVPNGRSWNGGGSGISILNFTSGTYIGGQTLSQRNVISGNAGHAITVAGDTGTTTTVLGNRIGTTVDGLAGIPNQGAGIKVEGSSTVIVGGINPGQGNQIAYNKGVGIDLTRLKAPAPGVALAGNLIHDNDRGGSIALAVRHPANDEGDADTGPNGLQNWPMPVAAVNQGGATLVAFDLSSFARGILVRVDAFAASGGGGSTLIGSRVISTGTDPADRYVITGTLQFTGSPVTLLATTQDGSSEFSPSVKVVSGLDSDGDGLPDALERQVPITSGPAPRNPSLGDRNGDGTADELQAHVASVQVPDDGDWFTLAANPGFSLTDVTGLRAVDVPPLQGGHLLQPGAVRFTLGGNTATPQAFTVLLPLLSADTTVWLQGPSGWQQIGSVSQSVTGNLSRLAFTLPARPSGSVWLLAIGRPMPTLKPPVLTLLPPEMRPTGRLDFSSPLGLDGAAPVVPPPPSEGLVQTVSISRPAGADQWILQTALDLNDWQNLPSDGTQSDITLTYPIQSGPRFFRWLVP